jgi:N-acetyl-gamma-glutamylphosphate reductase
MLAAQKVSEAERPDAGGEHRVQGVAKDFPDFYGKDNARNPVQQERVQGLATLANQIRAGAKAQGKSVSVADCIKQAHAVITAELRATTARKEIVAKVQKRSAQITARPNGRRNPATVGGKSKQAAAAAFEARAAELGIDFDSID